jgi:hypothetical protein
MLTEDLPATVEIGIKVSREIKQMMLHKGYGPEEIENIVGQKLAAIEQLIADVLDVI